MSCFSKESILIAAASGLSPSARQAAFDLEVWRSFHRDKSKDLQDLIEAVAGGLGPSTVADIIATAHTLSGFSLEHLRKNTYTLFQLGAKMRGRKVKHGVTSVVAPISRYRVSMSLDDADDSLELGEGKIAVHIDAPEFGCQMPPLVMANAEHQWVLLDEYFWGLFAPKPWHLVDVIRPMTGGRLSLMALEWLRRHRIDVSATISAETVTSARDELAHQRHLATIGKADPERLWAAAFALMQGKFDPPSGGVGHQKIMLCATLAVINARVALEGQRMDIKRKKGGSNG